MLVHLPLACWLLAPASDVAALATGRPFFWHVSAMLSVVGVALAVIAAMFGAMELERIKGRQAVERIAMTHASLMGGAWVAALIALALRIDNLMLTDIPAPAIVPVLDFLVAAIVSAGAFFGGEMVYRHGVGVKKDEI